MISEGRQTLAERGENMAEEYFRRKKYKVLIRNYRCRLGEIDLVLEKKKALVFVEVKSRSSSAFGAPEEAVNERKKRKLYQVAQCFLSENRLQNRELRFDVVSILVSDSMEAPRILHFENAIEF